MEGQTTHEGAAHAHEQNNSIGGLPSDSEAVMQQHRPAAQESASINEAQGKSAKRAVMGLGLLPLPTIESVMETGRLGGDASGGLQGAYKTVVRAPKPPRLRRREALDGELLGRVLREAARLRIDDGAVEERGNAGAESGRQRSEDDGSDVWMYGYDDAVGGTLDPRQDAHSVSGESRREDRLFLDSPLARDDGSENNTASPSPTLSFRTSASTLSEEDSSSTTSSLEKTSRFSPSDAETIMSAKYQRQSISSIPLLDLGDTLFDSDDEDEMDWDWSMNGGEIVYGAAGVAVVYFDELVSRGLYLGLASYHIIAGPDSEDLLGIDVPQDA
ncbi:hypothetical protein N0V90_004665 [Kalmusia sp. IMI 367209]|nr:hypothetical protein N0V90_004665 [Kalmusia sp. IMI 367209]